MCNVHTFTIESLIWCHKHFNRIFYFKIILFSSKTHCLCCAFMCDLDCWLIGINFCGWIEFGQLLKSRSRHSENALNAIEYKKKEAKSNRMRMTANKIRKKKQQQKWRDEVGWQMIGFNELFYMAASSTINIYSIENEFKFFCFFSSIFF